MAVGKEKPINLKRLAILMNDAKRLAKQYHSLTGRPLGITGEVAEFEAVRLLGLELAPVRQSGYDAVRTTPSGPEKLQIKGRCITKDCKPSQRLGLIKREADWDAVLFVLLDADFEPLAIYEAKRAQVIAALDAPGSKARERGALGVSKFKSIGTLVWKAMGV
jgi:hypothetical protein